MSSKRIIACMCPAGALVQHAGMMHGEERGSISTLHRQLICIYVAMNDGICPPYQTPQVHGFTGTGKAICHNYTHGCCERVIHLYKITGLSLMRRIEQTFLSH